MLKKSGIVFRKTINIHENVFGLAAIKACSIAVLIRTARLTEKLLSAGMGFAKTGMNHFKRMTIFSYKLSKNIHLRWDNYTGTLGLNTEAPKID